MVKALPIELKKLYVDKKVHHDTFTKVLADKNRQVLYSMYYLANGIIERQELFNCDDSEYLVFSTITTKIGLIGESKEQAKIAKLKGLAKSPYYKVRVIINRKIDNRLVFDFKYKTTNKVDVYDLIPRLEKRINNLLWKKD